MAGGTARGGAAGIRISAQLSPGSARDIGSHKMRLRQFVRQLELLQQNPGFGRGIFPCSKPRALNSQRARKRKIENWIIRK